MKNLRMLPLALVLCGGALLGTGQLARSDLTPLGQMNCGCGQRECVTKTRAVNAGMALTLGGAGLMALGAVGTAAQAVRRGRGQRTVLSQ